MGLTICWYTASIVPLMLFVKATVDEEDRKNGIQVDLVVIICGFIALAWIILLTYTAYELNLNFKKFIRISIVVFILRSFFWFIYGIIAKKRNS